MSASVLICLAPGSEEIEAVTAQDLLVRANIRVTTASVATDGNTEICCSRGVRLQADMPLVRVVDESFDAIVLPGGLEGAACFRDSELLVEKVRQMYQQGKIVAAICAAPVLVLHHHQIYPYGNMTCYPGLRDQLPNECWVDKRVVFDPRINLLTSQGPGTSIDFALKLIDLLVGREKTAEIAKQLVLPPRIYQYND